MQIYDCFMYFDEEIVLETRLNYLDQYVDYFVIIESCYTHRGDKRDLKFNINKFQKFKDKIIYKIYDKIPSTVEKVNDNDDEGTKSKKYIMNAIYRENGQRNYISEGVKEAKNEDLLLQKIFANFNALLEGNPSVNQLTLNEGISIMKWRASQPYGCAVPLSLQFNRNYRVGFCGD